MYTFITHHKFLFAVIYVAMPILLGWIGYILIEPPRNAQQDAIGNAVALSSSTALYKLPRVALSMSSGGNGHGMMKLDIGLEVKRSDLSRVADYEPRIIERIFFYMRGQSYEKLQEPDSSRWVRKGLEEEISNGAVPITIASVVVQRMVFQ